MNILRFISEQILPTPAAVRACRGVQASDMERYYLPRQLTTLSTVALADYREPAIRNAIIANKFHADRHAAQLLACLLSRWCEDQPTSVVIIPIPLSARRLHKRGHNQVETVARCVRLSDTIGPQIRTALKRVRDTAPQTSLARGARAKNVTGAFAVTSIDLADVPPNTTIVLLDDVITTGTTMAAARAALAPHLPPHVELTCIALAH